MFRAVAAAALCATSVAAMAQTRPQVQPQPQAPAASAAAPDMPAAKIAALEPQLTAQFQAWMKANNVPGLVYGVVTAQGPVLVRGLGVQDVATSQPVGAQSRFRIASMSKAFTALAIMKLRDEGKLSLDAPAETYVPEMKGWRYPTSDSRRIRVSDLLHHTAGFVEDNPWGDRQQPLSEADFTKLLAAGMDFAQPPGIRMEYSNLGYALLGRIVTNVSGMPYQDYITRNIMLPLGMRDTNYDVFAGDPARRALGYRWQDDAWVREPDMADGTFGAMGGVITTAADYAQWVRFLLSAWPARDGAESGPVRRATVREIVEGANFVRTAERTTDGVTCRFPTAYAKGWNVIQDCALGRIVTHSGGYPGYGSLLMLLPDAGVGVFAFANRTYAGPRQPVEAALNELRKAGLAEDRTIPVSPQLAEAYATMKAIWRSGDPARAPLAVNVALDRDLERRRQDIAALKAKVGTCDTEAPISPVSTAEGYFRWTCKTGNVAGRVQRAPTPGKELQVIDFRAAE